MKHLTEQEVNDRYQRIPEPIRNLGYDNLIVSRQIDHYVHGHIITLEEMQWQIIRDLSTDWTRVRKDYMDCLAMSVAPLYIPKQS